MGDPKDELANDVHVKSVLVMLPYDADKFIEKSAMKEQHLGLEINGVPAEKLNLSDRANVQHDSPVGTVFSFLDTHKQRVYYKLIADSDAVHSKNDHGLYDHNDSGKPQDYGAGHDGAAFIEVDANGNELKYPKTGKGHVIVTFPGMNDPGNHDFKDGVKDWAGDTTYQEKFFNDFVDKLSPELSKRGMSLSQAEVISHSMGDKFALEYDARYGAKTMLIAGWDKEDSAIGAATRNVLRDHLGQHLSDTEFQKEFTAKMKAMSHNVTEINADGFGHADFTPIDAQTRETIFGDQSYRMKGAGHTASFYMNKKDSDLIQDKPGDVNALIHNALTSHTFTMPIPLTSHVFMIHSPNRAQTSLIDVMDNEYDGMKERFESQGKLTKAEQKTLGDFQEKIDILREKLSNYGVGAADNMEQAAGTFLAAPKAVPVIQNTNAAPVPVRK